MHDIELKTPEDSYRILQFVISFVESFFFNEKMLILVTKMSLKSIGFIMKISENNM